jgi:hypothetical protein
MMDFIVLNPTLSVPMSAGDNLLRTQDTQGDLNSFGCAESLSVPSPDLLVPLPPELRLGEGEDPQGIFEQSPVFVLEEGDDFFAQAETQIKKRSVKEESVG